jgi:hypothetical protein
VTFYEYLEIKHESFLRKEVKNAERQQTWCEVRSKRIRIGGTGKKKSED